MYLSKFLLKGFLSIKISLSPVESLVRIANSDLLEIRDEDRKEKDFWVKWTTTYDDYDNDWHTTLERRPVFKEDNWKAESERQIEELKRQNVSDEEIRKRLPDAWHGNHWQTRAERDRNYTRAASGWVNMGKDPKPYLVQRQIKEKRR